MYHSISKIAGKPQDYKWCMFCHSINWYGNESCVNCGKGLSLKGGITPPMLTLPLTKKDGEKLLEDFEDNETKIEV